MWLLIPILIYTLVFLYTRHVHSCWKRRGFPSEKSSMRPRYLKCLFKREFNLIRALTDVYKQSRERFIGIYLLFRPLLLIRDITLVKDILENSERCFHNTDWNYMHMIKKLYYFDKIKMALTKDKLEDLYGSIDRIGDNMLEQLLESWPVQQQHTTNVDIQKIIETFTKDVLGKLFYGMDINSFKFPYNIFNQNITNTQLQQHWNFKSFISIKKLRTLLQQTIIYRELENVVHKDILQILIQIRNSQYLYGSQQTTWNIEVVTEREKSLTIEATIKLVEELTALLFETIPNIAVLTLLEVLQQEAQLTKVLNEIEETYKRDLTNKNHLNYNEIQDMTYTEFCIKETLRKYPPVPLIKRICNKNYRIPSSRHTLDAGYNVIIPVQEIQRDEKYFTEPLRYKPERFLTLDVKKWSSAYIPFGTGAKAEIAETLTILIVKVMLSKLLLTFEFETTRTTTTTAAQLLTNTTTADADAVKKFTKLNLKRKKILLKL